MVCHIKRKCFDYNPTWKLLHLEPSTQISLKFQILRGYTIFFPLQVEIAESLFREYCSPRKLKYPHHKALKRFKNKTK